MILHTSHLQPLSAKASANRYVNSGKEPAINPELVSMGQMCRDCSADRASNEEGPALVACPDYAGKRSSIDLLAFVPLVRSIARRIHASIPPYACIDLNDLVQSGHLGLVHAGRAYQSNRGVPFPVYARIRIRGEILDSLRQIDTASRGMRKLDKEMKLARLDLTARLKREPTQAEIVDRLAPDLKGSPAKKRSVTFFQLPSLALISLDDRENSGSEWYAPGPSPETLRSGDEARDLLLSAIARLPPKSREFIHLYYRDELTMREIGERFCVNESRVSQIHRRSLQSLARRLKATGISSSREI
jgi:RNA polymerase sigma factor FliA